MFGKGNTWQSKSNNCTEVCMLYEQPHAALCIQIGLPCGLEPFIWLKMCTHQTQQGQFLSVKSASPSLPLHPGQKRLPLHILFFLHVRPMEGCCLCLLSATTDWRSACTSYGVLHKHSMIACASYRLQKASAVQCSLCCSSLSHCTSVVLK